MAWLDHLTPVQRRLAEIMSETSELCYFAGWHEDTEFRLWHFATDPADDGDWGMYPIPADLRAELSALSAQIGGWICWYANDAGEQPRFAPMPEWLAMYERNALSLP